MSGSLFDPDLLDEDDPFEIDEGNLPHLYKHGDLTADDLAELWTDDEPRLFPAQPGFPADWDLVGELTGRGIVVVPLAKARSQNPSKARPITIFRANLTTQERYRQEL